MGNKVGVTLNTRVRGVNCTLQTSLTASTCALPRPQIHDLPLAKRVPFLSESLPWLQ